VPISVTLWVHARCYDRRVSLCSFAQCRPVLVSQHWATALGMEWTNQAMLEKRLDLPPTVKPADGPLMEAKSQVFFIEKFALPLFTIFSKAFPGQWYLIARP
jgi:hypothetical protein